MASHRSSKNGGLNNGIEETLDHISQLPDALLLQILSLLPTEDAVKSCVLSKRWRYVWTSIDHFLFIKSNSESDNFVSFVDHVLTHSTCSKIKKFHLDLDDTSDWNCELEISRWISFALERKVEDVLLFSRDCDLTYVLPIAMYANSSLITLDLSHWVLYEGQVIAWNSLKSLKLDWLELDDDDIVNLLSGCPALESLKLSAFQGFHRLEITSSNLKRLTLAGCSKPCENEEFLEIIAPHIQHLEISGDLGHLKCRLVNVSSLVTASLPFEITCITQSRDEDDDEEDICRDYHQVSENLVLDYLQKLSRVTQLTIGSWFAEVLFMLEENEHEEVPLPELRCKCLTLEMHVTEYNLYGVASLLRSSPLLETLNIHLGVKLTDFHCELELSCFDEVDNSSLRNWISDVVFPNLKNVKIVGCTEKCPKEFWCEGGDKLFKLSKFLIKNAVALKKFVIVGKRRQCWKCKESCFSRYLSQITKKLLDIPRSSKNVVISYEESALHD